MTSTSWNRTAPSGAKHKLLRGWPVEIPGTVGVVAGAALLVPLVSDFTAQSWNLYVIYGLLALSFTFVWGHAGIFSYGQAAFFGIGGYAYGTVGINLSIHTNESVTALLAAVVVAAFFAAVVGYFIFYGDVGDVYVAIITLAITLVLLTLMSSTADPKYRIGDAALGGYNGLVGVPPLLLPGGGAGTLLSTKGLLFASIVIAAAVAFGVHALRRRPFGRVLGGLRENELRTQLLGFDVRKYKLAAFVIGGGIAGLAGGLYAAWGTFISPEVFGLQQAALVAIWVLVGGRKSILGAFVGAALVQWISNELGGAGGDITGIVLGSILIAVVLVLPEGIVTSVSAAARGLWRRHRGTPPAASSRPLNRSHVASFDGGGKPAAEITAVDLHKQFGGVAALAGASLRVAPNAVHCLIGPNGAGKSTFFNLLTGRYRPTSGDVMIGEDRVTKLRPDARARRGLGIKLQVPCIYKDLPVEENIWLAAFGALRNIRRADVRTTAVLEWLNLVEKRTQVAGSLAHGEQQWLEIGMVMASDPKVVLLDEPTAGMTREETARAVGLIHDLASTATVIVVEHDMEFVRQLGAPVTMFHEGQVFATGSVDELRADERVLDTYLGRGATDAAR